MITTCLALGICKPGGWGDVPRGRGVALQGRHTFNMLATSHHAICFLAGQEGYKLNS